MNLSVRSRVMIWFSVITILITGLLSRFSYVALKEIYVNQIEEQMKLKAKWISEPLDTKYLNFLYPGKSLTTANQYYVSVLRKQQRIFNMTQVFIFDDQWIILAAADTTESGAFTRQEPDPVLQMNGQEIRESIRGKPVSTLMFKGKDEKWYLWGFLKLDDRHYLGVQENAEQLSDIENLSWIFWGILSTGIVFTFLGSLWIAQAIARPIDALVSFSRELGKGNLKAEIPEKLPAELSVLSRAMDRMRDDLIQQHHDKEQLLTHIAHEIRNPLGGMELLTGLIREDYQKEEKSTEYPDTVLNEINRLKALITAYLSYGRPISAKPESVEMEQLMAELKTLFQQTLEQKKIKLIWRLTASSVSFDPSHLRQILINLITNSVHAINSEGGQISITSRHDQNTDWIEIADNGPGIPDDVMDKIFDPFISRNSDGFGLGLAICRKLCHENYALIDRKNSSDPGCVFTIRIPINPDAART